MTKTGKCKKDSIVVTVRLSGDLYRFFREQQESEQAETEVIRKIIRTHPDFAKYLKNSAL